MNMQVIVVYVMPGGRFGNLFDDDPKQWRLYADFIGSAGRFDFTDLIDDTLCYGSCVL